jgi:hypothetical protein
MHLGRPVFMPNPRPPMGEPQKPDQGQGGPPAKRLKTEENLIPEAQFMARYASPVTFKVSTVFFCTGTCTAVLRIRIRMDPHHFGNPDPHPRAICIR